MRVVGVLTLTAAALAIILGLVIPVIRVRLALSSSSRTTKTPTLTSAEEPSAEVQGTNKDVLTTFLSRFLHIRVLPEIVTRDPDTLVSNFTVWWHAPFFSHGGYASEAASLMLGLHRLPAASLDLRISQHGDAVAQSAWQSMPRQDKEDLAAMASAVRRPLSKAAVIVCHSEPGAWALPQPLFQTSLCPPPGVAAITVGRTMFECDSLSTEHVRRLNAMDEVWVPTSWQRDIFAASGVHSHRLAVVPEPVDVEFFKPAGLSPLPLPMGQLAFGEGGEVDASQPPFRFLSIFKWESRKGWDVLLEAFLSEFTAGDNVELYMLTTPYHSKADFKDKMQIWAEQRGLTGNRASLPTVHVITDHIPAPDLPRLYLAADVFVLPSRGEGWGRPHVEAMAMGLPVIATNWSGPTAFLDASVGYPLPIDGLEEVTEAGAFKGRKWASPSLQHLRKLMRHVMQHPDEARQKGMLARQRMVEQYAPEVLAKILLGQLSRSMRQTLL